MTRQELTQASEDFIRDCLRRRLGDTVPVYLYGSRARGDAAWHADYDLWLDAELPRRLLADVEEEIENSFVPFAVDFVTTSDLNGRFGQRVRSESKRWL